MILIRIGIPLLCGLLFGIGLAVSGMTDTRVVLGFLDITGDWNPALAFVMGGALAITIPGFWLTQKRAQPLLDKAFHLPANCRIESKPLLGSAIFGIGWGLYGYCPGPALASLGTLDLQPLLFVAAMMAGVYLEKMLSSAQKN
jgi:uncharacterized membrane protein YedE/YeeE